MRRRAPKWARSEFAGKPEKAYFGAKAARKSVTVKDFVRFKQEGEE